MAKYRYALALLPFMLAGCATFDEAIIRTATLEKIPAPDCVQRVIESVAQPIAMPQHVHTDWTHEITGHLTHSVDAFTFKLDNTASPPLTISISEMQGNTSPLLGSGWNYRFHWNYGRAESHRLTEVAALARTIERGISAQCGIAPFSDRVQDSGGMYRSIPPLV